MIEFIDLYKKFGSKEVLKGLSFNAHAGEILFILGRSGTGKSVLLKSLVGLIKPDSGKIRVDQQEIQNLSEEDFLPIRRRCSLVFQLPALIDSRNLHENLSFGVRHLPILEQIERGQRALENVGLEHLKDSLIKRFPPQLSYGEQKRMALARSLVINPDYLLYDEPTTGLDGVASLKIHQLIFSVSRTLKKTSLVVSHDMKLALATADRIVVLDGGGVLAQGTPQEIFENQTPLLKDFMRGLKKLPERLKC